MPQAVLIGLVVVAANAGLMVLQLVAGKMLAPYVGSSLETWAAVIGTFLAGIAVGNAVGGKLADRFPSSRLLPGVLLVGAAAAAWAVLVPIVLDATAWHRLLPLGPRIPVLAAVLGFPVSCALAVLTPVAVRAGLRDITAAGRAAGRVFALGTLGCLAGNYVTGFYLMSWFPIDTLALGVAGVLLILAGVTRVWTRRHPSPGPSPKRGGESDFSPPSLLGNGAGRLVLLPLPRAYIVVFLCSFAAMALELSAVRMLAQPFGVSLFTWTGAIGVMLAGTATGNWLGGWWAAGADRLAGTFVTTAGATVLVVAFVIVAGRTDFLAGWDLPARIVGWSLVIFFPPMALLGTISPQVVRLAVPDVEHTGRVTGRVYAWSTVGAIAGTIVTGFWLFETIGMLRTVLLAALLPAAAVGLVSPVWKRTALLYPLGLVGGAAVAGLFAFTPALTGITEETNYYAIYVKRAKDERGVVVPNQFTLQLDSLVHSRVDLTDPTFLHYKHERVQMDILHAVHARVLNPRVLVIGGGGYTFPRYAKTLFPSCSMDVVEIDPGVTVVSYEKLGLDPKLGIVSHHLDGRQFVTESAEPAAYDLVTLDAVNDLSVPGHLLTAEFAREVKRCLAPRGVYLVSVIDVPEYGTLWKSVLRTLGEVFPHVEVLSGSAAWDPRGQTVFVFYAGSEPIDWSTLKQTYRPPVDVSGVIAAPVLTDRFAPVDQMMVEVYRRRKIER
jgi:spermidine synthase